MLPVIMEYNDFISIHAPRVGGDPTNEAMIWIPVYFNPRPPCGGRRRNGSHRWQSNYISIHAPRVGGDADYLWFSGDSKHFNPRPPCGGRPRLHDRLQGNILFQSTPPVWGATLSRDILGWNCSVFQSTPPVWGATLTRTPGR